MITIFNTLLALGTLALGLFTLITIVLLALKHESVSLLSKHSSTILRIILIGCAVGSLTYELVFGYSPCLLCWYQRMALFPLAILMLTANIRTSKLLQIQVLVFSSLGLLFALYHNFIDMFPGVGPDVCGTGPSCLLRYVNVFGFVTIPFMSAIVLISVIVLTLLVRRYPQSPLV